MKYSIVAAFVTAVSALVVDTNDLGARDASNLDARSASCNADNCLRAVRATRLGTATMQARMAECNAFLLVTQTPSASTVYVTKNIVTTVDPNAKVKQRQAPPAAKTVPAYASACTDLARFSSACSCFGASAATTMAPTPTVTSTITVVATTTLAAKPAVRECANAFQCVGAEPFVPWCQTRQACVCFKTAEGASVCADPSSCEIGCDTSSDCPTGNVCVVETCCSRGACIRADICVDPAAPARMFKRDSSLPAMLVPHDTSADKMS